jgi:hypothetical protein
MSEKAHLKNRLFPLFHNAAQTLARLSQFCWTGVLA